MVIFQLREISLAGLDGRGSTIGHAIERQTEKAILLAVVHRSSGGERKTCYWLPKSQVKLDGLKPFGEIKLDAFKKIEIPDWLWEKRVPA
jgi:hypothetical protein